MPAVFLFLIIGGLGLHMLIVIKAPLKMDSLYQNTAKFNNGRGTDTDYPPIVHQIWLDHMNVPQKWTEARNKTIQMNPSMKHMLWTSKEIEPFLVQEYPWFVETYLAYSYLSQKVDAARYFIVYHYGGVYMDMDFIVNVSFVEIYDKYTVRNYECAFPATWPSGISNALFACNKHSRFMKFVTSNLQNSDRWYVLPYATAMWSAGPRFLTKCMGAYPDQSKTIFVLPIYYFTSVYFTHLHGSTWHRWDAKLVKAVYEIISSKWLVIVLLVAICIRLIASKYYRRCFQPTSSAKSTQ
jgi:mannosyltransferase OCH1-like enzyme